MDIYLGSIYVSRTADEEYHPDCIVPKDRQGKLRVMVWACAIHDRKGPLVVLDHPGGQDGGMTGAWY